MTGRFPKLLCVGLAGLLLLWAPQTVTAREASFVQPGAAAGKGTTTEALVAEPKELDTGESISGIARRVTLFFSNASAMPVTINKIAVNGDSNVTVETVSNDCKDTAKIPSGSRCAVVMSVTPSSAGPWSVEVLATHDGVGRIARAQISGETLGDKKSDKQTMGLAMSGQKIEPVDFGEVEATIGEAVRTALVSNDSAVDLTVLSIDLVAPSNGLGLLEQGCEVDQTLRPGESCPITLRWVPEGRGTVSTDLIVRHTGRVGFIVIPVRGKATGEVDFVSSGGKSKASAHKSKKEKNTTETGQPPADTAVSPSTTATETPLQAETGSSGAIQPPPTALQLEELTKNLKPLSHGAIKQAASSTQDGNQSKPEPAAISLIGTVGQKGIFKIGDATKILAVGSSMVSDSTTIKVLKIDARSAEIDVDGKTKTIDLVQKRLISMPAGENASQQGGDR